MFLRQLPGSPAGLWCLFCPRWQTGAPGDRLVLARGGYLTNPLDDTEPPHRDGETHRLFLCFAPSSLVTFLFSFPGGIFCQRRTAVLSRPGQGALLAAEGMTLSGASELPSRCTVVRPSVRPSVSPPRGCSSGGRSGRFAASAAASMRCLSDRFKCSHCAKRPLPLLHLHLHLRLL